MDDEEEDEEEAPDSLTSNQATGTRFMIRQDKGWSTDHHGPVAERDGTCLLLKLEAGSRARRGDSLRPIDNSNKRALVPKIYRPNLYERHCHRLFLGAGGLWSVSLTLMD